MKEFHLLFDLKTMQEFDRWIGNKPRAVSTRGYSLANSYYYISISIPHEDAPLFILTWGEYFETSI